MPRHHYKQAFIKSPKLKFQLIEVVRISEGIALLKALGEGSILVCTKKRTPDGYFAMAECAIQELIGKTELEIFELLDKRTDRLMEIEKQRRV
jgi:hypothetical protein